MEIKKLSLVWAFRSRVFMQLLNARAKPKHKKPEEKNKLSKFEKFSLFGRLGVA
jgi:hypothetical protein